MDLKLGFQFRSQRQEVQMAINSTEVAQSLGCFSRRRHSTNHYIGQRKHSPLVYDWLVCQIVPCEVSGRHLGKNCNPTTIGNCAVWGKASPSSCCLLCSPGFVAMPLQAGRGNPASAPFISFNFQREREVPAP